MTEAERRALLKLSSDLPGVWHAKTTTIQDRQEIVRLLIERVVVACRGRTEWVDADGPMGRRSRRSTSCVARSWDMSN